MDWIFGIFSAVTSAEERKEGREFMVMFACEQKLGARYSLQRMRMSKRKIL